MNSTAEMIRTHSRRPLMDEKLLATCLEECFSCAQTCVSCSDACLGEENPATLRRCIRLNEDCASACMAAGQMLSRLTEASTPVLRAQVEACRVACAECGAECENHAGHMEHCRVCAQSCHSCERACRDLLAVLA